jgi:hypothetical protein
MKELITNKKTTKKHGLSGHRIYKIWSSMLHRCYNPNNKRYSDWGGRGINVCNEWHDVKNFIVDMYPTYKEGLSLDRIDNDKGYSKENCRWVEDVVQKRNTRKLQKNNTSGYRGVYFDKYANKWSVIIGVNKKKIKIGYFKTAEEGARAYDKYVIDNNLEHPTNFKIKDK